MSTNSRNNRSRRFWIVGVVGAVVVVIGVLLWNTLPDEPLPDETETPTPTPLVIVTPTLAPTPFISITTIVDLRSGPGENYPTLIQVQPGEIAFAIVGRNEDSTWLQVCCVGSEQAWVDQQTVSVQNDLQTVLIVETPLPPDTPTPTETSTTIDTPTPTDTPIPTDTPTPTDSPTATDTATEVPTATATPTPTATSVPVLGLIGRSIEGREILSYRWGTGNAKLALVGGIHGGYEVNTIDLMYNVIEHFRSSPNEISENVTLYIIPSLNPDGEARWRTDTEIQKNALLARNNANNVDLNRNFDCQWQEFSKHRDRTVWAGSQAFSEPETRAIRDFVVSEGIDAIIFYHSQGKWVEDGVCAESSQRTKEFGQQVANTIRFRFLSDGSSYEVTGDGPGYFNQIGIVALGIELTNHEDPEFGIQLPGILAAIRWVNSNLN